jgi:actin-like protein 6B
VAISKPQKHYEFPTGYNAFYGHERFTVGEQLFNHSPALVVCLPFPTPLPLLSTTQATNPNLPKTIPQLIGESLRACEPDLRQVLIGNVVLTGGGTFLAGFADRLSNELSRNFNHVRCF